MVCKHKNKTINRIILILFILLINLNITFWIFKKIFKTINYLKPTLLPILHQIIGLILFWENATVLMYTYSLISFVLIFFLIDVNKNIFRNILEISSFFLVVMIIAFFLPGAEKVLAIRYIGITILSCILFFYFKKHYYLSKIKKAI